MNPDDYCPLLNFAYWYLQQIAANQTFHEGVFFTDDVTIKRSNMFHIPNSRHMML